MPKKYDKEPIGWITRGGKHVPIFDKGLSDMSPEQKAKLDTIKNNPAKEYINHYVTKTGGLIVDYKQNNIYKRSQFGIKGGWDKTTEYINYDFEAKKPYTKR